MPLARCYRHRVGAKAAPCVLCSPLRDALRLAPGLVPVASVDTSQTNPVPVTLSPEDKSVTVNDLPTRNAVLERYKSLKNASIDLDTVLPKTSGQRYYNTSRYVLSNLGETETCANLEDYVTKFSASTRL